MLQLDLFEKDPQTLLIWEVEKLQKKSEVALRNLSRYSFGKAEDLKQMIDILKAKK
jgi:hypothetical protein